MKNKRKLEDRMTPEAAAALVSVGWFLADLKRGEKFNKALFSLLAPVAMVFALPKLWKGSVQALNEKWGVKGDEDKNSENEDASGE